jgi:hypothetical protein
MKRKFFTLLAIASTSFAFSQVAQIPLVEHFTQASCGPCASQNPTLKATLDNFGAANYVKVTHQTSWPGVDPMNADFPAGPDVRRNYYNVNGVPDAALNGGTTGPPNTVVTNATLTSAASQMTPYDIDVSHSWPSTNSITVDIDVTNTTASPISDADRIYVVMVEDEITYDNPPGSNGETEFYFVMREMYNASTGAAGATGGATLGTIAAGATTSYSFTIPSVPSYIADKTEITFAVFVQNNGSKTVYQAGKSPQVSIPGLVDVEASAASSAASGFCDYAFTPAVEFTNNDGLTAVTEVVAEYSINGGTAVQETFTGNLTSGQSTTITFPATTLATGTSVVSYEIVSVNGGQDWTSNSAVAISDETYNKLSASGTAVPVSEGFESSVLEAGTGYSREVSTGLFVDGGVAINNFGVVDGPLYNYGSHGGFGNSDRMIRARLFSISNGTKMSFILDKINTTTGTTLTFDHAYRQYQTQNDRLKVRVSTDCGATWTEVFNEAGASLATTTPSTSSWNSPEANAWQANVVDLTAYDNTNDLVVEFEITSAFGNNMFLDNINISAAAGIEEANEASFSIFPNPAIDEFTVSLTDAGQSVIEVIDVQGKIVSTQTVAGASNILINTEDFGAGLYTVVVKNDNGVAVQKVIVQ